MAEQPPGGYAGKILRVNLSANTTSVEELDEKFCRKYIGGAGFIALKKIVCCAKNEFDKARSATNNKR